MARGIDQASAPVDRRLGQHLLHAADPRVLGHGHQQGARAHGGVPHRQRRGRDTSLTCGAVKALGVLQGYSSENRVTPLALTT